MIGRKGEGEGMSSRRRDHLIYGCSTEFDAGSVVADPATLDMISDQCLDRYVTESK